MPEKPNPCNLKLVVLCDPEDESCCVWRHNLGPEDARQKLDELRNEGLFAFTVDQRSHHAGKASRYNPLVMREHPRVRHRAKPVSGEDTALGACGIQVRFDGTIVSACRGLDGGITTFINLARALKSSDPRAAQFLDGWDSLDAGARRDPSAADVLCERIGIVPRELLHKVAVMTAELCGNLAATKAALALPEIVGAAIDSALAVEGQKDRKMLFRHSGFLPVPRGATSNVNQLGSTACDPSYKSFEQEILEVETMDGENHSA